MIIACPNCAARYDIDDSRFLPGGRSVRCSQCHTSWFVPAPQGVETLMASSRISGDEMSRHGEDRDGLFAPAPAPEARPPRRRDNDQPRAVPEVAPDEPQSRPKWGPMAERRVPDHPPDHGSDPHGEGLMWKAPLRRSDDHIVDTQWQEVGTAKPEPTRRERPSDGSTPEAARNAGANTTILLPLGADGEGAGTGISMHGSDGVDRQSAIPGEAFAAVNVQPRELERALKRVRRKAEARDKNRLTPMRLAGWASLFMVIATLFYGGYHYRDDIVRIAPGSARVYASVGVDVSPYGLSLRNIDHRVGLATTGPIVEIFGELHNQGDRPITVPLLQAEALDVHGKLLASWTFSPDDSSIAGDGLVKFSTRAPAPEGIVEVVLSFAPETGRKQNR